MFTVHMVGLIYMDACRVDGKRALAPDGTRCGMGLPPHFTSLWVDINRYQSSDWWPGEMVPHVLKVKEADKEKEIIVLEFRIPERAEVSFSLDDGTVDVGNLDKGLPMLKAQFQTFQFDDETPNALAQVPIRGGALNAYRLGKSGSVQWKVQQHQDPITITARVGKREWTIKLRRYEELMKDPTTALQDLGIEVVLSNAPNLIKEDDAHGDHGANGHEGGVAHFSLYGKLDKERNGRDLRDPDLSMIKKLDPLPYDHGLLRYLSYGQQVPDGECTPSCC